MLCRLNRPPRRLAKQQLRILIFPGTEVLWKQFPEVPPPQGHHVLVPPPPRPSDEEAADAMEVAGITANMCAPVLTLLLVVRSLGLNIWA
jgi:hypothetical protein